MLTLLAVLLGLYALLLVAARATYRHVLFPAPSSGPPFVPPGASLEQLRAGVVAIVHALYIPAPPGARTIVCFHGNGETIVDNVGVARELSARGLGVMFVEYRGYGLSRSEAALPTEAGLYLDAEAALDALVAKGVSPSETALWGTSLGSGVAAEMASRGRGAALILVTPFTSIPRMASRVAPFLPASLYIVDRFDTLGKAPRIRVPTLVIHGDADELVPYAMGREVASAIDGARLVTVKGGRHNNLLALEGSRMLDAIARHAESAGGS